MKNSKEIINGIKSGDRNTWEYLYEKMYPVVEKYVTANSGTKDDAKDILQNTFVKIWKKCGKGFDHDNIEAVIVRRIKWDWLSELKSRKDKINTEISDEQIITRPSTFEKEDREISKIDLIKRFKITKNILKQIKKTIRMEDYLDYSNLNDIQKRMIAIFLDPDKTTQLCSKLLFLSTFLPISDNVLIARKMGYIKSDDPEDIRKGLDKLSTQKNRCIKRFKEQLIA
ncbi:MAG: sigma-70 family RNA polymerase sigma factor [Bacteroidetes bacterium]|nr:sigma-70 family RNA polymerase sigma factor [Bacteroidota bacterium]